MNQPAENQDELTRWQKIVGWFSLWVKAAMAVKKTIVLLLGIGAVGVAGNVAEINPWKEGAVEVGLIEEDVSRETMVGPTVVEHTHGLEKHTHAIVQHEHILNLRENADFRKLKSELTEMRKKLEVHAHDFTVTAKDLEDLLPADHMELH